MRVFSIRDLRNRSAELIRETESGGIAVVTRHGEPVLLGFPFSERTLREGVDLDIALRLFETGSISLQKAARTCGMSVEAFMDLLHEYGIVAVDYPPETMDDEIAL